MAKQYRNNQNQTSQPKMFALAMVILTGVIILAGLSVWPRSSTTPTQTNSASTPPTAKGSEPNAPMTAGAGRVPTSLSEVGEFGENIYDFAKASDWTQATAKLDSLKSAAKQVHTDLKSATTDLSQLDARIAALDLALAVKDRDAAMRDANQVTWIAANMTAPFKPPVPVEVTQLDYYGRQLEIDSATKDLARLKQTASDMRRTWEAVRPSVEAHKGMAEAKTFGNLVRRVEAAQSVEDYSRLATPVLDEVDNLEKVFQTR